ncbi:MAG: hypothetical protein ACYSW4_01150 [Planctomycetota bacterium]
MLSLAIIIVAHMDETYETKKYEADKIALLGFFAAGLLIAHLIVASRHAIVLSEPIELDYAGLSVSIPVGNGWQSEKKWEYHKNTFILKSVFNPGAGISATAHCRYLLAGTRASPEILFQETASDIDSVIVKIHQMRTGMLTIDWAHIQDPETQHSMFFGIVELPNGRQLEIAVLQATEDAGRAEQVFKRIAETLTFKDNQLLRAGREIIAEIKHKGISAFLDKLGWQSFFLIKDVTGRTVGFTMDVAVNTASDAGLNIQSAGLLYIPGGYGQERVMFLQSDDSFDEFSWKSETAAPGQRSSTEILLGEDSVLTVTRLNQSKEKQTYRLSSASIPDFLLDLVFSQMLESDRSKIIVDTINADGRLVEVVISRVKNRDSTLSQIESAYTLRVHFLGDRGFSEDVYLDSEGRISEIRRDGAYRFERTSAEGVLRLFPERSDYILKKNKLPEPNQPQR